MATDWTIYDAQFAEAIANFRNHEDWSTSLVRWGVLGRVERIVSAAVLEVLQERHIEGEPRLVNFHCTLSEESLDLKLSELVEAALTWATIPGTPVDSIDGDAVTTRFDAPFNDPPKSRTPKSIDEWLEDNK